MSRRPAANRCRSACIPIWILLLLTASPVGAQIREPVGPFAADLKMAIPRFGEDPGVAAALGIDSVAMPGGGLGVIAGAHWYPTHLGRVILGIGGELLVSRGSRTPQVEGDEAEQPPVDPGPTVNTRLTALSPQISLNFGTNRGWSYLTGGLGWGNFTIEREDMPVGDGESRPRVLNYGGGARWFAREHLALVLDLRFYAVAAQPASISRPAYPSKTMMVISGGVAFN